MNKKQETKQYILEAIKGKAYCYKKEDYEEITDEEFQYYLDNK